MVSDKNLTFAYLFFLNFRDHLEVENILGILYCIDYFCGLKYYII